MLVGVWLGLLWVLFYFFDHYIQSSQTQVQKRRHMEHACTQSAQIQTHMHNAQTHAGAALQW